MSALTELLGGILIGVLASHVCVLDDVAPWVEDSDNETVTFCELDATAGTPSVALISMPIDSA